MPSLLARASYVSGFLLIYASAQAAAPAAPSEKAVHAIEQSMRVLRKHPRNGDVFISAVNGEKVSVTLRPASNVVIVHHGFLGAEQKGYFPDANGKLSEGQRASMAEYLAREPGVDGHTVMRNIRSSIHAHVAEENRLARAEPLVKSLLSDAAKAADGVPIYKQGRTRMYVRSTPFGATLVVDKTFSPFSRELDLHKAAGGGYELSPDDRSKLGLILAPR
jgi:hypothetical protein